MKLILEPSVLQPVVACLAIEIVYLLAVGIGNLGHRLRVVVDEVLDVLRLGGGSEGAVVGGGNVLVVVLWVAQQLQVGQAHTLAARRRLQHQLEGGEGRVGATVHLSLAVAARIGEGVGADVLPGVAIDRAEHLQLLQVAVGIVGAHHNEALHHVRTAAPEDDFLGAPQLRQLEDGEVVLVEKGTEVGLETHGLVGAVVDDAVVGERLLRSYAAKG